MKKRFNTTGTCNPTKHYMVDITKRVDEIEELVNSEFYFVINRPRQFGKTTTLSALYRRLKDENLVIKISFESLGNESFADSKSFCRNLIGLLSTYLSDYGNLLAKYSDITTMFELRNFIIELTKNRDVVLIIDEVDKMSNNRVFLDFLGILRALYLDREDGIISTFKSVILAGIYDIKNLKLKTANPSEVRYNSPWNIAVDFDIRMSFSADEIKTMLEDYNLCNNNILTNLDELSECIYKFTNGYPFLVSRICQIIDDKIVSSNKRNWSVTDIYKAIKMLLQEHNTLFDDLIKNLENSNELRKFLEDILLENTIKVFNIDNPVINIAYILGYVIEKDGYVEISNQVIKERIYNYMVSTMK